ncbi:N-glycosylation protein-domain-containing protein [Trametes punicea]|nr:N-glycosylation protein-domain-containing protein [Trametes punicea]
MPATDGAEQQDPPPYGPPSGVLIVPAAVELLVAGHSSHPSVISSSTYRDRIPPAPAAATGSAPRHRSHTIATTPPRRRRHSAARVHATTVFAMSAPSSSPPPYSFTPPEVEPIGPTKRAASSPHLRGPAFPSMSFSAPDHSAAAPYPASASASHSHGLHSRQVFSEYSRSRVGVHPVSDEDDDDESGAETDDGVLFGSHRRSLADTLRHRLMGGKGKGRAGAYDERWTKPITTAPGALCAGETETEGEDSPRNLPTARIRPSSLSQQVQLPSSTAWLVQVLFQLFRLLAIVPAVFGTLWNVYHVIVPPDGNDAWRVDYFVSALWSVLTGWQCLQLTTGLLKRWKVYYSPFATLIRLLALQAICWPATHLTLSVLDHEARPLACWALIGTTTCCSRSVQLWVTSNIVPVALPHAHASHPSSHLSSHSSAHVPLSASATGSTLATGFRSPSAGAWAEVEARYWLRRRGWGGRADAQGQEAQVGLGAGRRQVRVARGIVYCVMAWALALRREVFGC